MKRFGERVQVLAAASVAVGGVLLGLAGGSRATPLAPQDKGDKAAAAKATDPVCEYLGKGPTKEIAGDLSLGINGCRACHNGADKGEAQGYVKNYKSNEFVLLNESETWVIQDIHSQSLTTLKGPLGQRMEKTLGRKDSAYKVVEDVRCLTCHSADKSPTKPLAQKAYKDFATAAGGVNCTVCHGMHEKWQIDHTKEPDQETLPPPWRSKTPEFKWERGMADLRNPVVKARLCVSCHVGSPAEGKVVTHEMYAAGHPPLPPFELASFMEGEPKHWAYPTDERLKFFATVPAEDRWPLFHFHPAKDESYLSRHHAVGAVSAMRAEAELLLADADVAARGGDILDYARFDCYSCHHNIPNEARQARGYDGPPGRPPLRAAIGIPAGVVAKHAEGIEAGGLNAKAAGYDQRWAALKSAATARPFGHPAQVKQAAQAMIDWCDGFLKVQCDTPKPLYSAEHAARLRTLIAETATGPGASDPEVAMSLAWAHLTLSREANLNPDAGKLNALGETIPLNVRVAPFSEKATDATRPVNAQFDARMRKVNAFQPAPFRDAFLGLFPGK